MTCTHKRRVNHADVTLLETCGRPASPTCQGRCPKHERSMDAIVRRTNAISRRWVEAYFDGLITRDTYQAARRRLDAAKRRWGGRP